MVSERKRYDIASEILDNISLRYAQSGWGIADVDLLEKLSTCEKVLGADDKYLISCLRLLEILPANATTKRMHYERELSEACHSLTQGRFTLSRHSETRESPFFSFSTELVREAETIFHIEVVGLVGSSTSPDNSALVLRVFSSLASVRVLCRAIHLTRLI